MIEILDIQWFSGGPIHCLPGDTIKVVHENGTNTRLLTEQKINEACTFECSILFKLDGKMQHIIGTKETIEWLENQT